MKTSQAIKFFALCAALTSTNAFATKPTSMQKSKTAMKSSNEKDEDFKLQTWNPLRLLVLKAGLTEPAWTSPWNYQKKQVGTFTCAFCGQELFDTASKYDSGSGWPSFWRSSQDGNVRLVREFDGRVECSCSRCKSHLGHVFMDGPQKQTLDATKVATIPESDPKGRGENARTPRFCVNGASLQFKKEGGEE